MNPTKALTVLERLRLLITDTETPEKIELKRTINEIKDRFLPLLKDDLNDD